MLMQVIQLQGDQRKNVSTFLVQVISIGKIYKVVNFVRKWKKNLPFSWISGWYCEEGAYQDTWFLIEATLTKMQFWMGVVDIVMILMPSVRVWLINTENNGYYVNVWTGVVFLICLVYVPSLFICYGKYNAVFVLINVVLV